MKRVWKPLDVADKRLYAVTLEYFNKAGNGRVYGDSEPPKLVLAYSPMQAAELVHRIYNKPDYPVRVECYGKAANVLMPESWWQDGVPCIHDLETQEQSK